MHAENARELWVGFHRKDSGRPSITWPESVDEALCVGWIDGLRKSIDASSYMIRFTPRRATSNWIEVNIKRVGELTPRSECNLPAWPRSPDERKPGLGFTPTNNERPRRWMSQRRSDSGPTHQPGNFQRNPRGTPHRHLACGQREETGDAAKAVGDSDCRLRCGSIHRGTATRAEGPGLTSHAAFISHEIDRRKIAHQWTGLLRRDHPPRSEKNRRADGRTNFQS